MNGAMKLALPAILGISAAFVNYVLMNETIRTHKFLRIDKAVTAGTVIDRSMLKEFEMPGDFESLVRTFVNDDGFLHSGMIAMRDLHPGDMLLWQDLARPEDRVKLPHGRKLTFVDLSNCPIEFRFVRPGILISFVTVGEDGKTTRIGPYEIHAVGADVSRADDTAEELSPESRQRKDRIIGLSLEVDEQGNYEENSEKLIQAIVERRIRMVDLDHASGLLDRENRIQPGNVKTLGLSDELRRADQLQRGSEDSRS